MLSRLLRTRVAFIRSIVGRSLRGCVPTNIPDPLFKAAPLPEPKPEQHGGYEDTGRASPDERRYERLHRSLHPRGHVCARRIHFPIEGCLVLARFQQPLHVCADLVKVEGLHEDRVDGTVGFARSAAVTGEQDELSSPRGAALRG